MTTNEHTEQSERTELIRELLNDAGCGDYGAIADTLRKAAALLAADKAGGEVVAHQLTELQIHEMWTHRKCIAAIQSGDLLAQLVYLVRCVEHHYGIGGDET